MDPDLQLMQALQSGNDSALNALIVRHQEGLFYFCFRYLRNEAAARDVVQETFVRTYFKASKFKPRASVKTWLYTIALNLCRDYFRKLGIRGETYSLDAIASDSRALRDPVTGPDLTTEKKERYALLQAAIDRLPGKLRDVIVLFSIDEKSQKETADILKTTPKTVELRVYHAKKKLKAMLDSGGETHDSGQHSQKYGPNDLTS